MEVLYIRKPSTSPYINASYNLARIVVVNFPLTQCLGDEDGVKEHGLKQENQKDFCVLKRNRRYVFKLKMR